MSSADAITVAPLTIADVDPYRRLRLRALAEQPDAFRSDAEEEAARPLRWWEQRLAPRAESDAAFFGAWTMSRELVGTAGLLFETRVKTRHTTKVVGMYVAPEHGGRGLGARLLAACIECCRSDPSIEVVYLTVTSTNTGAIRLYERAGFVAYGCEPRSMRIDGQRLDKLMMALELRR